LCCSGLGSVQSCLVWSCLVMNQCSPAVYGDELLPSCLMVMIQCSAQIVLGDESVNHNSGDVLLVRIM
jgi:hypothetical protein